MIDLLGRLLVEAEQELTTQGVAFEVIESAPPNNKENEGFPRVIRQQEKEGVQYLTVCRIPDAYK
ncbi:MAG: hypothetical protein PHQ50_02380 [Eubacteriales bacterium]|nr:hypothetical protein [Eubacteriales bacterium]MDD3349884.1 hypothetical protein [Eubacteriales bacterium]